MRVRTEANSPLQAPEALPDFSKIRSEAEAAPPDQSARKRKRSEASAGERDPQRPSGPSTRLFVGSLPFVTNATDVRRALVGTGGDSPEEVKLVHWLNDRQTGLFFGSAFVEFGALAAAERAAARAASTGGIKLGGRRLRVRFSPPFETDEWPPSRAELERPMNAPPS